LLQKRVRRLGDTEAKGEKEAPQGREGEVNEEEKKGRENKDSICSTIS